MVLCSALCAAFSFACASRSRIVGFSSRAIFLFANSRKAAVIASASRLLKRPGIGDVLRWYLSSGRNPPDTFRNGGKCLDILVGYLDICQPCVLARKLFEGLLAPVDLRLLVLLHLQNCLMAFSSVCSLIFAPSIMRATALPVTSSCIYSRPLRPSPYISCCTREE